MTPAYVSVLPGWLLRLAAAGAVFLAAAFAGASPASAHAALEDANPGPGVGFSQAPGAVALRFSEPLQRGLSRIEVIGPDGRDAAVGPTVAVERDPLAMQRKLGLLRPGIYRVRWISVSRFDGHTLRGSYSFGVGTATSGDERQQASPVDSEGWLGLAGRWTAIVGLSMWAGVVVLVGVARRGGLAPRRLVVLARFGPYLALVGTTASVASTAMVATGSIAKVTEVLTGGQSGHLRIVELAAALAGVVVPPRLRSAHAPLVALAVFAEVASGHAASSVVPWAAAVSAALHLGAVGIWLVALVGAMAAPSARRFLGAVWPYAVGAGLAVAVTGTLNAFLELTRPSDLWSTGYGQAVLVKVVLLLAMGALGVGHQLLRRRPGTTDGHLRRPVGMELVAGGLALAAATALVGFPNPPRIVDAAERAAGEDPVLAGLATRDALSLGDASGPYVVALTVLPPKPGPVELRVNVVGVEAGDGLGDVMVRASGPNGTTATVALAGCGSGCFRSSARISDVGRWSFRVTAASTRAPVDVAFAADLPTPDGRAALDQAVTRLERLRSLAMAEDLRGSADGPTIPAQYRFSAPSAFEFAVGDRTQIVIGNRTYDREKPDLPWIAKPWPGDPFRWPLGYYRTVWAGPAAVRLLGMEQLDGQAMSVIAFARPELPAWIRLWVGVGDGLVHREQMRADGHLMDRTYKEFNTSMALAPPVGAKQPPAEDRGPAPG